MNRLKGPAIANRSGTFTYTAEDLLGTAGVPVHRKTVAA